MDPRTLVLLFAFLIPSFLLGRACGREGLEHLMPRPECDVAMEACRQRCDERVEVARIEGSETCERAGVGQ
jgi:hypothetical protein